MPRFYHGKQMGFVYKARAVGWRRIPPLSLFPYLTGDEIQIHLSLKPLYKGQEWESGIIQIEPPDLAKLNLARDKVEVTVSNHVFPFVEPAKYFRGLPAPPKYHFPINQWWSRTISLKGGVRFGQPGNFICTLVLQNVYDDHFEDTAPIRIADVEVQSRAQFYMWLFTTFIAVSALVAALLK